MKLEASSKHQVKLFSMDCPTIKPMGKMVRHTVAWLKEDNGSLLQKNCKQILAVALAVILAISFVGIPVLILALREWRRESGTNPLHQLKPLKTEYLPEEITEEIKSPSLNEAGQEIVIPLIKKEPTASELFRNLEEKTKELLHAATFLDRQKDWLCLFNNIPCLAKTAVQVSGFDYPYLHANRVQFLKGDLPLSKNDPGKLLSRWYLAQAPVGPDEGYPKDTRGQFWKAVLQNTNLILDITMPADKTSQYCPEEIHQAWSSTGKVQFDNMIVTVSEILELEHGIKLFKLSVKEGAAGISKMVTRIHFPSWTDHGGIDKKNLPKLVYLCSLIKKHFAASKNSQAPLVHCRAGVGRSGTFAALFTLMELHQENLLTKENAQDLIESIVLKGRQQRGPSFVQSEMQLKTLLDFADLLTSTEGSAVGSLEKSDKTAESQPPTPEASKTSPAMDPSQIVSKLQQKGVNTKQDETDLDNAVSELLPKVLNGTLSAEEKKSLYQSLQSIKLAAGLQWNSVYVAHDAVATDGIKLSESVKSKINHVMNAIQSNVPPEVKKHPAFRYELISLPNPVQAAGSLVTAKLQDLEKTGNAPSALFIYRDSSTHTGPKDIHTFTLTYSCKDELGTIQKNNVRMAYNARTLRWQLAHPPGEQTKSTPLYDLESSSVIVTVAGESEKIEQFKQWYPDQLTFDKEGNIINSFPSLEAATLVIISKYTNLPPQKIAALAD